MCCTFTCFWQDEKVLVRTWKENCVSGGKKTKKKHTEQQRMSVKCVLFVLCARNRYDGSLITGCGSDDATPRARLCCLSDAGCNSHSRPNLCFFCF